jgi:hypothetical protein
LTGNRGFSEIFVLVSEFHSLDAKTPANARPNGHASSGLRVLQHWIKRVFHVQLAGRNTIWACLSNGYWDHKMRFLSLSDDRAVVN